MLNYDRMQKLKTANARLMHYTPQPQQEAVHRSTKNLIIISGGEGSGKSVVTAGEIAIRYGTWKKVLFVCYKTDSARNEGDYLFEYLDSVKAVTEYRTPKGAALELSLRGGESVESVSTHAEGPRAVSGTGKSYDIIAMLEAGKQSYSVFTSCLLRASRTGGLLLVSGTIERSEPWFPDLLNHLKPGNELEAEVVIMPTWENRTLYPGGLEDPKIQLLKRTLTKELFLERLGGQPSPLESLVLKDFSYLTHVFDWVQYDPTQTVELWMDPGYSGSHYSVSFVQFHPRAYTRQFYPTLPDAPLTDVWVIGDLYLNHAVHEEVIQQCKKLPWWDHVVGGVGDVVGKTHPQAGQSPFDVWSTKASLALRGQYILIPDNVDRHHTFLKDPGTNSPRIFYHPKVEGLVEYSRWKRKEIGENLYGDPESRNCDFLKAIGYGLIDHFGRVDRTHQPGAHVAGQRMPTQESANQLPTGLGTVEVPQTTQTRVVRKTHYIVVPRGPRLVVGGLSQPKGDRIV